MGKIKENRKAIRVGIKQLTSIIKSGGEYELIEGSDQAKPVTIHIKDISTGGLCIESKQEIKAGVSLDLQIKKRKNLSASLISCEVMRSIFREDPMIHTNIGTDRDTSYFEIGLKFKDANTEYLKQLHNLAVTNQI